MAGSSFSGGSFTPTDADDNRGLNGFLAVLDAASNPLGLTTLAPVAGGYTGATVMNRSTQNYIRATITPVAGSLIPPGEDVQLVPPGASVSWSFDEDAISTVNVQAVAPNAPGSIVDASALVPGIAGLAQVTINLVNG